MRSVADLRDIYVLNGDGREELYDRQSDPHNSAYLARSPHAREPLIRLREVLRGLTKDDSSSPPTAGEAGSEEVGNAVGAADGLRGEPGVGAGDERRPSEPPRS